MHEVAMMMKSICAHSINYTSGSGTKPRREQRRFTCTAVPAVMVGAMAVTTVPLLHHRHHLCAQLGSGMISDNNHSLGGTTTSSNSSSSSNNNNNNKASSSSNNNNKVKTP